MCYYFNSKNQQRDRNSQNVKIWEANPPDIDITLLSNQIFCVPWYSIHEKKDTILGRKFVRMNRCISFLKIRNCHR